MSSNAIIQKFIIASLILFVLTLPIESNGEDDQLTCPLTSEVPIGQLLDQTSLTSDKILKEAVKMINASFLSVAAANQMVTLTDSCSVNNCSSSCDSHTEYNSCDTSCHPDYNCSLQSIKKGSSISNSVYNCANMNHFDPDNDSYYSEFSLSFKHPPCTIPPCSGKCYRPACEELICDPQTCEGDACPFTEIEQKFQTIDTSDDQIIASNKIISDVFVKNVIELQPLLGNICDIPILKFICLVAGKPEINIILDLFTKSYENINDCKTSNFELEKMLTSGDTGEILLPCQALIPDPFKECYINNYYCCH